MTSELESIKRPTRESNELTLFDMDPDWREHWWGMPEFSMGDASPQRRITINFMTDDDVAEFAQKINATIQPQCNSLWYPYRQRRDLLGYQYYGEGIVPRYPVCIPSKGRHACQTTGTVLDEMGVPYHFFVEETEEDLYKAALGEDKVIVMPFHDLGHGSVPARNFIWEWAKERGYSRHWTVDDNILEFCRCNYNSKLRVNSGGFFTAIESFVDRYENIVMAGPHDRGFVDDRASIAPFLLNSRVYSCILLDTNINDRWRGRYNEDTDLSLRLLKQGHCTALFRSLLMRKGGTVGAKTSAMPGGNTDNVYNTGDHRRAFAESLKEQHPDVVEVVWKFNRWHHHVDYSPFKKNKPVLKEGVTPTKTVNEYGMKIVRVKGGEE